MDFSNWVKHGLVFLNSGGHPKNMSHSANPLPVKISGNVFRVFYSGRDEFNRSSVAAVDVDISTLEILKSVSEPFVEHGEEDDFFSHGISIGNTYKVNGNSYILYMGWRVENDEHWFGQVGRLRLNQDHTLSFDGSKPYMALDEEDPISLSYPWVMEHEGLYRMWYGSTVSWDAGNGEMLHVIKYAESLDGNSWVKKGVAIPFELGVAQAFSRPTVIIDSESVFHMWFSYRSGSGSTYRIGYSKSSDGKEWSFPKLSLSVGENGWDSEMVEYPYVIEHEGEYIMFFNGSAYGKTGFGIARHPAL